MCEGVGMVGKRLSQGRRRRLWWRRLKGGGDGHGTGFSDYYTRLEGRTKTWIKLRDVIQPCSSLRTHYRECNQRGLTSWLPGNCIH